MEYTVGSIADLISGKSSSSNVKVVKQEIRNTSIDFNSDNRSDEVPVVKSKQRKNKKKTKAKKDDVDDLVVIKPEDLQTVDEDEQEFGDEDAQESGKESEESDDDEKDAKPEVKEFDAAAKAEQDARSIFVGNVPVATSKGKLLRLFRPFGPIQSVRMRGLAPENPMINRRTVGIKKLIHPKRNSVIAYVVFRKQEDAFKALKLNGTKFDDHYLRVTKLQEDKSRSAAKAIFIGQLDFEAEDNDLWEAFESCGPITSVRVVRDKFGVGTGIGYVNFNSADSVELALQMEGVQIKKRICRINRCNNPKDKKIKTENNKFICNSKEKFKNPKKFGKDQTNVKKAVFKGRVGKKADKKKVNKDMAQKMKLAGKIAPK